MARFGVRSESRWPPARSAENFIFSLFPHSIKPMQIDLSGYVSVLLVAIVVAVILWKLLKRKKTVNVSTGTQSRIVHLVHVRFLVMSLRLRLAHLAICLRVMMYRRKMDSDKAKQLAIHSVVAGSLAEKSKSCQSRESISGAASPRHEPEPQSQGTSFFPIIVWKLLS